MKKVAVFFDEPGFDSYPFNKEEYRTAYYELAAMVAEKGGVFCIARGQDTFLGENTFSRGWSFAEGEFKEQDTPLKVDLVYDKGYFRSDGKSAVLNDRDFDKICTDKWETYKLFPALSPLTRLVTSSEELTEALKEFGDKRLVAKPLDGQEGKGVLAGTPAEIAPQITTFPYLLQEFIDTSGGIPGIVEGIHDFRIIAVSGEPVVSYVRTPPPGKVLANVALGGREIPVPVEAIPEGAIALFREVDAVMTRYPKRVYSVDMGRQSDGAWKIIELNSKPGLTPCRMGPRYERFLRLLAEMFVA